MRRSRILITGGCGFIGSSLVKKLIEISSPAAIVILDNLSTGTPEDLAEVSSFVTSSPSECTAHDGIILVNGDIRNAQTAMDCTKNIDCIVHLAANTGVTPSVENPRIDLECNVLGTFNMLESARAHGVKKFIFASSGAPAGEVEPPIHEEVAPHPVSPYGASKLAGEGYCSAYFRTFGIGTVCLRFGNVYGPRSKKKSSVVAKFIRQALSGASCVIYGDGTQTRDFIYIDDLLRAILLSMKREVGGEVFQIATGMERTVGEVAQIISNALDRRGIGMKITHDAPRLGDVKRNYADTRKADRMLGWRAQMSIEQGIERTIDYFLDMPAVGAAIDKEL
jgi:UDP-glucose 4-epimerase